MVVGAVVVVAQVVGPVVVAEVVLFAASFAHELPGHGCLPADAAGVRRIDSAIPAPSRLSRYAAVVLVMAAAPLRGFAL